MLFLFGESRTGLVLPAINQKRIHKWKPRKIKVDKCPRCEAPKRKGICCPACAYRENDRH